MTTQYAMNLLHFLSDEKNYQILKFLLNQHEQVSNREISIAVKMKRTTCLLRLKKFVSFGLLEIHVATMKYEQEKKRHDFMLMYYLKPRVRTKMNEFVDILEKWPWS